MPDESAEVEAIKSKMLQKSYYLMFRNVLDGSRVPGFDAGSLSLVDRPRKTGQSFCLRPSV